MKEQKRTGSLPHFNFFLIHFEMVLTCLLYAHHIYDEVENTIIVAKRRIKKDFLFG